MARNSRNSSSNSRGADDRSDRSDRSGSRREGSSRSGGGRSSAVEMDSTEDRWTGEGQVHAHRTAKVVELVCSSTESFERAIQNCLEDARATTRGITGAHVEGMSVKCQDGAIVEYKVNLKVSFGVERTAQP